MESYDTNNIFAKILRQEFDSERIYEDSEILVIKDKFPDKNWETHLLFLPKRNFTNFETFCQSRDQEISRFFKKIQQITEYLGFRSYQLMTNNGKDAGQEIMHFHVHLKTHDKIPKQNH